MNNRVSDEKLTQYFSVTERALEMARSAPVVDAAAVEVVLDMASRYVSDAHHFAHNQDVVLAFAALNYAHGWLDCGARLGVFVVRDSTLFTVDE